MPEREVFVRGLQYPSSRDAIGVLQHAVDGGMVYVPASFDDGGEDVVIQMEPRIAELDDEGMEQGEERRNEEIAQEMEVQGVGAINEGVVDDKSQDFVDASNDPIN
ncbi:hypothetical protein Tco_1507036 [Tanacetum coccineum]